MSSLGKPLLCQEMYDALPNVRMFGTFVKDGSTLKGEAAVAFLVSNGYMRCSRKFGIATLSRTTHNEHEGMIMNIPLSTLMQLQHRDDVRQRR